MKNLIYKTFAITLCSAVLLLTSSCRDYLTVESPSTTSQEVVFDNLSSTESAIIGVYNQLTGDDGWGSRIATLYPQTADDFKTSGDYNPDDRRGISTYGPSSANFELLRPFRQLYSGIERANIAIKYIQLSELYRNGTDKEQAQMRQFLGEALTLRAMFYLELVKNWGDLPARFEPAADLEDQFLPKTDRDIIYDRLLDDLKLAEEYIPWRTESGYPTTRITKAAVKGLRARIALTRGGYSLRKESKMMERKPDYLIYYQIARQECAEIMERRDQHDLTPNYEELFKSLHGGNSGLDVANEIIWQVGAYGGGAATDSKIGYYNGFRTNPLSRFGRGGGGILAIPTYFYEFDSIGDVRRDVTIGWYEVDAEDKVIITRARNWTDAKYRRSWTNIGGTSQYLAIRWPLIRFADILLMFAEADNEINGGPSGEAISALEEVRRRAFVGHEDRMGNIPTDRAGFFNAIVQERLLEFGGEGLRKYDLIRWNLLGTKIEETRHKLYQFMEGEGRYANLPARISYKPGEFNPETPSRILTASIELHGGQLTEVIFSPEPETSAGNDFVRINWRQDINADYIYSERQGYAIFFEPNRKELYPLHDQVLQLNYNLTQDFGL